MADICTLWAPSSCFCRRAGVCV